MKKTTLLIALIILATAYAGNAQYDQDYYRMFKPFKTSVGVGYAAPVSGKGSGAGMLGYLEPGYRLTDQVLLGLRLEWALMVRGIVSVKNRQASGDLSSVGSYTLSAVYYLKNTTVRPFVGAGVGFYRLAATKVNILANDPLSDNVSAESRFGFYPRVGVDIGHFNFIVDYNVIPPTDVPAGGEVRNNYLGIHAGVSIGGGKTDNRRSMMKRKPGATGLRMPFLNQSSDRPIPKKNHNP